MVKILFIVYIKSYFVILEKRYFFEIMFEEFWIKNEQEVINFSGNAQ